MSSGYGSGPKQSGDDDEKVEGEHSAEGVDDAREPSNVGASCCNGRDATDYCNVVNTSYARDDGIHSHSFWIVILQVLYNRFYAKIYPIGNPQTPGKGI